MDEVPLGLRMIERCAHHWFRSKIDDRINTHLSNRTEANGTTHVPPSFSSADTFSTFVLDWGVEARPRDAKARIIIKKHNLFLSLKNASSLLSSIEMAKSVTIV